MTQTGIVGNQKGRYRMRKSITSSILGLALAAGICGCRSVPKTAACGGAAVPAGPRLLHLSFDAEGEAQALDTSPNGNHGQVRGAVWTPFGKSGGAYEFDGQKDYIELGPTDLYQPQGELSGSAWVYRQERSILVLSNYRGGSAYNGQFFFAIESGGHLDVLMGQGPDQYVRYLSEEADLVPMNEWHHIAFSYNERLGEGHKIQLYVDGKDVGRYVIQREGTGGPVLRNGDRLRIMAHQAMGPNCFAKGKVDEVMLFNRALSAEDVRQIHDAQK
jgi:hypothetical protein